MTLTPFVRRRKVRELAVLLRCVGRVIDAQELLSRLEASGRGGRDVVPAYRDVDFDAELEAARLMRGDKQGEVEASARRSVGTHPDPTGTLALAGPDEISVRRARIDASLSAAVPILARLDRDVAWALADPPTLAGDVDLDPGCDLCRRVERPDGKGQTYSPVSRPATTVGGRLDGPLSLCGWHYDWVRGVGEAPSDTQTAEYLRGSKPRRVPASLARPPKRRRRRR